MVLPRKKKKSPGATGSCRITAPERDYRMFHFLICRLYSHNNIKQYHVYSLLSLHTKLCVFMKAVF